MLWLALAVACSVSIAMIFKATERRGLDRTAVLAVNYLAATVLSVVLLDVSSALRPQPSLIVLGVFVGALFIGGFYLFALAIRAAGMGLATGVMRLAVVIPVLASWGIWNEQPTTGQFVGLALAGAAFFLIARPGPGGGGDEPQRGWRAAGVLGALFLAGGLVDVSFKVFGEVFADTTSRALFLLFVFGVAAAIGVGGVLMRGLRRGAWPQPAVWTWGLVLGLVNYGSAEFILRAVEVLRGPLVFPVNNIAIVMGAAVLGVAVWGERLSRLNVAGLVLAALALALITS